MTTTEKESVLAQNRLIAEFMGYESNLYPKLPNKVHKDDSSIYLPDAKYHNSWDWLMPVVEKIESFGHVVSITEAYCIINTVMGDRVDDVGGGDYTKLTATYEAVITFINWYNQQQPADK